MSSVKSAVDEKWKHAEHLLTQGDFRDEEGEPQLSPSVVATDRAKYHTSYFRGCMLPPTQAVSNVLHTQTQQK